MSEKKERRFGYVTTFAVTIVFLFWVALIALLAVSIQTGSFLSTWQNIGEGQAEIISSTIAAVGLLTSAILVPFVFKDRIRDLDSAVDDMGETIGNFEADASNKLDQLSELLNDRMAEIERRNSDDVDRLGELLEEIRSAVILSISDGQISDPKHAKIFVQHLYNDAVAALKRRTREKPHLHEKTRIEISRIRAMTAIYLDKLIQTNIISSDERRVIDRVKKLAYRHSGFQISDISEINNTRSDFDSAFGENTVSNVDEN